MKTLWEFTCFLIRCVRFGHLGAIQPQTKAHQQRRKTVSTPIEARPQVRTGEVMDAAEELVVIQRRLWATAHLLENEFADLIDRLDAEPHLKAAIFGMLIDGLENQAHDIEQVSLRLSQAVA